MKNGLDSPIGTYDIFRPYLVSTLKRCGKQGDQEENKSEESHSSDTEQEEQLLDARQIEAKQKLESKMRRACIDSK